jgi:threonine aldolase
MRLVGELAHAQGLSTHLDGARVFNAAIAQGIEIKEITEPMDTVTFCLSKGLCAPVGSVLCGSSAFIKKAHRLRKMLGGGMRQAGILAAAGIVALETMVERLVEDHIRAKKLADALRQIPGLLLQPGNPATNMVFLSLADSILYSTEEIRKRLYDHGVLVGITGERQFRLVLHYWIDDGGVMDTVAAFQSAVK